MMNFKVFAEEIKAVFRKANIERETAAKIYRLH
jgi:hypothetical protein